MALRLTPDLLAAAYDFLRETQPFKGWKLPESDDLEFRVTRHGDRFGHFFADKRKKWAHFAVSERVVKTSASLIETLGHEMIHLKEHAEGVEWPGGDHGPTFMRHARAVCRAHGFAIADFL